MIKFFIMRMVFCVIILFSSLSFLFGQTLRITPGATRICPGRAYDFGVNLTLQDYIDSKLVCESCTGVCEIVAASFRVVWAVESQGELRYQITDPVISDDEHGNGSLDFPTFHVNSTEIGNGYKLTCSIGILSIRVEDGDESEWWNCALSGMIDPDGGVPVYEHKAIIDQASLIPDKDDFEQPIVSDDDCGTEITLIPSSQLPSGHFFKWSVDEWANELGDSYTIYENTTFDVRRIVEVGHEEPDCVYEDDVTFQAYKTPDSGEVIHLSDDICEGSFKLQNIDIGSDLVNIGVCTAHSVSWWFGDGKTEIIDLNPNNDWFFSPTSQEISAASEIYHAYEKPSSKYFDDPTTNYVVRSRVNYNCGPSEISGECVPVTDAIPLQQEIIAPLVNLEPSYENNACTTLFDYEITFTHPRTNEELDHVLIVGQQWEFEENAELMSNEHSFEYYFTEPASKFVKLSVYYLCEPCGVLDQPNTIEVIFEIPEDLLETSEVSGVVPELINALSNGTSTFTSAWPLTDNRPFIEGLHPYQKGSAGVWRSDGSYYSKTKKRTQTSPLNLQTDGTYSFQSFHHGAFAEELNSQYWTSAGGITKYNSSNSEIENKNALDIFSAAIYTFDQKQPLAVGANMGFEEMAFTSFEDVKLGYAGNFTIGDQMTLSAEPIANREYLSRTEVLKIKAGKDNVAIFDIPLSELNMYTSGEVISSSHAARVNILCTGTENENGNDEVFAVFDERVSSENYSGYFVANLPRLYVDATPLESHGHTGEHSLGVVGTKTFNQHLLKLKPNKTYFLSAWVAVEPGNTEYSTDILAENMSIDIKFIGASASNDQSLLLVGPIVEGWQQIQGTFETPATFDYISITFDSGAAAKAYFDDLRLFPEQGNMTAYVYDKLFRVIASLDENNFATYFSYDQSGKMQTLRKETSRGIQTIQESVNYVIPNPANDE